MRLRVVEIIGSLQIGGAENQVVQLLNGWDSERIEKHIVFFRDMDTPFSRALERDVKRHYVELPRHGQIGCILRLTHLLRQIRPHVVQAHMFHTNLYVVLAAYLARVPVVITTEHGKNLWKNTIHHLIEGYIISPLSTLRIAVSKDIQRIRVCTGDVPEDKIIVIPPCVEIPECAVEYQARSPIRIGAVGRMVSAKDYPTLLRAFAHVIEFGIHAELIFLGDGPDRPQLEQLAFDLGLSGFVHFPGFQSNVGKWLRDFDLVVFSSVREGIPVAMLEAMAIGVPVVATQVGGIPEVIRDGLDGLLVESGSPDALADAMIKIARDVDQRQAIGTRGRERVASLFSRKVICGRYEELFHKLLIGRKFCVQQ